MTTRRPQTDFTRLDEYFSNVDFLVPGDDRSSQYMVAIHTRFYQWARRWTTGAMVLEAGCGEGYGALILAEKAAHVVAIDIKPKLIYHARRRYPKDNLSFSVMDCTRLSLGSDSFNVVVCDELIEHLPEHQSFLEQANRLLIPGGRFICATTNAQVSFRKSNGAPLNRNHFREFTGESLEAELHKHFGRIEGFSQLANPAYYTYAMDKKSRTIERVLIQMGIKHKIPIRWRNAVRERLTGVRVEQVVHQDFEVVEGYDDRALYAIAIATKL